MEPLTERLALIERHIGRAVNAVEEDAAASPVLKAVLLEFQRKSHKARQALFGGSDGREVIVELEQAGDSANVAAKADAGASEATRKAVDLAHLSICLLKAGAPAQPE